MLSVCRWIQKCADVFEEQWRGIVHVVEDTSVIDVALADLSSTKVRRFMKQKKDVKNLVGDRVYKYMKKHKIVEKMHPKGPDEWTEKDGSMDKIKPHKIPEIDRSGNSWTVVESTDEEKAHASQSQSQPKSSHHNKSTETKKAT